MNTQKNAYEIRLDILKIANDNLWKEYFEKFAALQTSEIADNGNNKTGACYSTAAKFLPTPVSIKEYAEELYKFVDNK